MLDRPPLTDAKITETLATSWGFDVPRLDFLELGHDANAWTFRADRVAGEPVFVKVRRTIDPVRLAALAALSEHNDAVVAPLRTADGDLSAPVDGLHVVAYPFVEARPAAEVGRLSDAQWEAYGAFVGALHRTTLPPEIAQALPHERFEPPSIPVLERVVAALHVEPGIADDLALELRGVWQTHRAEIDAIGRRTTELAAALRATLGRDGPLRLVPCHGDVHTHNVLVDRDGSLVVVDWDDIVMAPRERDLMFIIGSPIGLRRSQNDLERFFQGYGPVEIDPRRLAYYHAEWAVQDVTNYAEQALDPASGRPSRLDALRIFTGLFAPGDEVDVALR